MEKNGYTISVCGSGSPLNEGGVVPSFPEPDFAKVRSGEPVLKNV